METSLDIRTNGRVVELKGQAYAMDFDNLALSYAEQVYRDQYGSEVNVAQIISDLFDARLSAIMALTYGAMRSAGAVMTWMDFSKHVFTYENFDAVFSVVREAILDMFQPGETEDGAEESPKN